MSKKSGIAGILLFIVFAVLVFVSKTYYSRNLPEVMGVLPEIGKLTKEEKAYGTAQWPDTLTTYASLSGTVEEILVTDGSMVVAGTPVIKLTFNLDELRYSLRQLELDFERNQLDEQDITARITNLQREISEVKAEMYGEIEPFEEDVSLTLALEQLNEQLADAKKTLEDEQKLYDAGAITLSDLASLQKNITHIENSITIAEADIQKARQQYDKGVEQSNTEAEQRSKKQIQSLNDSIEAAQRELQSISLNERTLSLSRERLKSQLEAFGGKEIINAPETGKILNIHVNPGQTVSQGMPLFELGYGDVMGVTVSLPINNDFVNVGDSTLLRDPASNINYGARVTKIEVAEHDKRVTLHASTDDIAYGRTYEAIFTKTAGIPYDTVPNSAINRESLGYFVYIIKRRDGALGKEFYIEKFYIQVIDADNDKTAVEPKPPEPVMYISNKPVTADMSVRLMNEGDFVVE